MILDERDHRLIDALSDGEFHSGVELSQALGVTRVTVSNRLSHLEQLGLEVASVRGRGYRLLSPIERLDETLIRSHFSDDASRYCQGFTHLDVIDSTNTYLLEQAKHGVASGQVCLAEHQISGRGRMGRNWVSAYGHNLYLSLLWRFEQVSQVQGLSLAVGVVVARALQGVMGLDRVQLKWPNDIWVDGRKLGGILIEMVGEVHGSAALVLGVGINGRLPHTADQAIDQAWTDLDRSGFPLPGKRNLLASRILSGLFTLLHHYPVSGLSPYLKTFRSLHGAAGQRAHILAGSSELEGTILDVNDQGHLLMDLGASGIREFASGEVRFRVLPT